MHINGGFNLENYLGIEDIFDIKNSMSYGYKYIRIDNYLSPTEFSTIIDILSKEYEITEYNYSKSKFKLDKKYISHNFVITIMGNSKSVGMNLYCKDEKILNYIFNLYIKNSKSDNDSEVFCLFDSYYMKGNQIDKSNKVINYENVSSISNSYYPFIDTDILFEQFTTGQENVLVLTGEPGIGKTKFCNLLLKYMFEHPENIPYDKTSISEDEINYINVSYIKNTDILCNDEFWRKIQADFPDLIILDDLDYMLTKRDSDIMSQEDLKKNDFLNQLLSFTDGVEKNKTKIIITTNQKFTDVDDALLRKGRLFDILQFRKLTLDEALVVWLESELDKDDFYNTFKTHDVFASELGSEISKRKNERSKNALKSYLKEDGISKIPNKSKKMGF